MQIITEELYLVVNKEDWENHEYFNLRRYSYTSILEAVKDANANQLVIPLRMFISEMIQNHENDAVAGKY